MEKYVITLSWNVSQSFKRIGKKQWHEFAAEVIDTTLQNYSERSLVLEDFSDPENIADD